MLTTCHHPLLSFAKDCLLTGQEQSCSRITLGCSFVRLPPCRKWLQTQENGRLMPPSDHIHRRNPFSDQSFAQLTLGLVIQLFTFHILHYFLHFLISSINFKVGVVFLPCGHLATCVSCAPTLTNCPVCRQDVLPTFFLTFFFTFCLTKCFDIRQCVPFPSLYSLQHFCLQDFHSSYCSHFPLLILYFSI